MNNKMLYSILAFAGVIPFVACALLPLAGIASLPLFGALDELAGSYGLAIVSFLTGIHWATYLYRQDEVPFNLMISSNVVFLVAWFAFVLGDTSAALFAQLVALIVLLLIDHQLKARALITRDYFRTRSIATVLAAGSILIILAS
jgi:hypothetical protein